MSSDSIFPITVYGSSISYFTGKLENYFRIKGIPYQMQALSARHNADLIKEKTGSTQMPALELADGRWMSDSTPIIKSTTRINTQCTMKICRLSKESRARSCFH